MYFVKSKKNLEDQDAIEPMESKRRDRYQRSDSARLLLQAMPPQQSKSDQLQHQQLAADNGKVPYPKPVPADTFVAGSIADPVEFRPEELPDGACYRPKKDLKNLATAAKGNTVTDSDPKAVVASSPEMMSEQVRSAEYVGTFSVSGSDKAARERQMEQQLMQMRSSANSKPVRLCISSTGVKVILQENDNVFMDHSLKRIWYATCDPESCQFSFLAREPKTSAEVQYCHAFHTQSAEQAEELIAIIGQAFKSSSPAVEPEPPAAPPRQPTFHELIEQQVQQQQAKFREIEEEQKTALQEKLQQIATPTPLSKHAQHRMEQRRQSEDVEAGMGQGRLWA
ncbi:uncharacterized protein LOC106011806, partial [Aplysia californica]|uniref:Uncharacterized protein LOC106011806 n=1 Tax=Aplysia californica TaxID=6500 RepID=A0ABM1A088_APLCA